MKTFRYLRRAAVALLLGALTACGGGGGGDGGGGGGSPPVTYSGNTSAAVLTLSNASTMVAAAMGGSDVAGTVSSVSGSSEPSAGQGPVNVGRRLSRIVRATVTQRPDGTSKLTSAPFDLGFQGCSNGGSVHIFGDINPSGTGTATVVYSACNEGGDVLSGSATMRIDAVVVPPPPADITLTDFMMSFGVLSLRGSVNLDMGGSFRVETDIPTNTEKITENIVTRNNATGRMTMSQNVVFVDTYDSLDNPTLYTEVVSGRVFHSIHGFVDISTSTSTPLRFPSLMQAFPNGGEMVLTGAVNRRIRVTPNSVSLVTLGLDLDGDGAFEREVPLAWSALTGPIGADLGDDDNDGMHNSWETVHGLVDDATADSDNDGFSNLSEYLGGGNPTSNAVIPPLGIGAPFPVASDIAVANSNEEIPGKSAIAFDGTNYLLVSCRELGPSLGVFGVLISRTGAVLSNFLISTDLCPQRPAASFDGTNYLVALSRGGQIVGIRVSTTGVPDGAGFAISTTGTSNFLPAVAFDGTNYLVVWNKFVGGTQYEIYGATVPTSGSASAEFPVFTAAGEQVNPKIAFDGTNYLVVWRDTPGSGPTLDSHIVGTRVAPNETVLDPAGIAIATAVGGKEPGGVAFDGTNFLVVWDHALTLNFFPPPDGKIFGRRVAPDGTLQDGAASSDGIPIATGLFRNHSSSVAFAGSTFLVTWAVGAFPNSPPAGIYAARVSKAGARLDGASTEIGVPVSGSPGPVSRFVHPVAAAGGQSALIAWVDNIEGCCSQKDVIAAPIVGP